jgi:hypothetical protein
VFKLRIVKPLFWRRGYRRLPCIFGLLHFAADHLVTNMALRSLIFYSKSAGAQLNVLKKWNPSPLEFEFLNELELIFVFLTERNRETGQIREPFWGGFAWQLFGPRWQSAAATPLSRTIGSCQKRRDAALCRRSP